MKSLVVFGPKRVMMWCQPRRIPRPLRVSRAIALASSSTMPTSIWSAMRWTALRVRARMSISRSTENFSPVASSSASMVIRCLLGEWTTST